MEYLLFVFEFLLDQFSKKIKLPKNILIVRIDNLGDVCTSLPSIYLLNKKFPNAKIEILANESLHKLLIGFKFINDVFPYEKLGKTVWNKTINFFHLLRERRCLWLLALRENYLLFLTSLPFIFRFRRFSRGSTRILYKFHRIKQPHEVDSCIKTLFPSLAKVSWNHQGIISYFNFDLENMDCNLKKIITSKKCLLILPGAGWIYRKWPRDYFVSFIRLISAQIDYCLLAGDIEDREDCNYIQNKLKSTNIKVINLVNKLNLRQLAYLMHMGWLVLCNDSGPMHLASLFNARLFALFGPQDPRRFGPWSTRSHYFLAPTRECWPCKQKECKTPNNPCIYDIKPEMLINKFKNENNSDIS